MNEELELEQDLRRAFAAHRVDPQSFRAGIQARLERASREPAPAPAPTAWSRAAALLPLEVPLSASPSWCLTLALPVLGLAACGAGFWEGWRALRGGTVSSPRPNFWGRWGLYWVLLVLCMAALLWGGSLALDLVLWILVLSMSACVVVLRQALAQGHADRPLLASLATQILGALVMGCFLWLALPSFPIADTSRWGLGVASTVVLLGIPVCWWRAREFVRAGVALLWISAMAVFFNLPGCTQSSATSGQAQLATLQAQLDPHELSGWEAAAAWHQALQATGVEVAPAAALRSALERALSGSERVHPSVWTSAQQLGVVDAALWRALAQDPLQAHSLQQLRQHGLLNPTPYYQYLVPMLLATQTLDASERARVVQALVQQWPAPGEWGALPRAQACLAGLEQLAAQPELEALRARVPDLLRAHWVSPAQRGLLLPAGGFSPDPARIRTGMDDDTLAALALMQRSGAPSELDLHLLHATLRRASAGTWWAPHSTLLRAKSRAALLRLREGVGLPQRTWLESILAERVLWAALCLVALCWIAVGLAPRQAPAAARGAAL